MSPSAFSRWFKARVGCVFHRYLNEMRVAMVCAKLSGGEGNITETAFQCGYGNLANFNRRFREITGFTPRNFGSDAPGAAGKHENIHHAAGPPRRHPRGAMASAQNRLRPVRYQPSLKSR